MERPAADADLLDGQQADAFVADADNAGGDVSGALDVEAPGETANPRRSPREHSRLLRPSALFDKRDDCLVLATETVELSVHGALSDARKSSTKPCAQKPQGGG
jgi:hypothetical protein